MKNRTIDLANHLMVQVELLSDENLSPEKLLQEIDRSKALCGLGDTVIDACALQLKAFQAAQDAGLHPKHVPLLIEQDAPFLPDTKQ